MSTYDKSIEISREEEGTYHRREVDFRPRSPVTTTSTTSHPVTTRYIERYQEPSRSRAIKPQRNTTTATTTTMHSSDDEDNFEEWTTSKRKVNHKTRQVETRVSRQLLVRGGEVIADSGPQVTTRIKEDNKVEECEREKTPKNKSRFEALENAPEAAEASGLVLGEKKEIQRKSREVREENMQYHDERFKELTGKDVHRRAIQAPHELITINDKAHAASSKPRGKMVHYSNKGKKYQDTDEILEVAKLAIDGSITKEVKHTKHHEEFSEDELPDEKGEAEQLRRKPVVERSSRRHADYVNDFDQANAEPDEYNSAVQHYDSDHSSRIHHSKAGGKVHGSAKPARKNPMTREEEEAFPRYQIDPLLNSLRDEDFKPITTTATNSASTMPIYSTKQQPKSRRRGQSASSVSSASSDHDPYNQRSGGSNSRQSRNRSPVAVEVPEEYRVNKQKLMAGGRSAAAAGSTLSHKSNRSQQHATSSRRREDAATQARLTDEEVERQSLRSNSPSLNSHEKTTKYLQRQSTPNSSRHYYYGDTRRGRSNNKEIRGKTVTTKRPSSLSSTSSSASSSLAQQRKHGAQSRDSGFKSPHSNRAETPMSTNGGDHKQQQQQQLYATSTKSRSRPGAVSPTESLGQRSVKTTTTTLSAGLADRPLAADRKNRKSAAAATAPSGQEQTRSKSRNSDNKLHDDHQTQRIKRRQRQATSEEEEEGDDQRSVITITNSKRAEQSFDTISLASLQGPNATKIKVPYQRVIEIERERASNGAGRANVQQKREKSSASEMSLQEDIESLSKRLASISQPQHFDYKTVVANVQGAPMRQPLIDRSYNVRIQQQNSPFQGEPASHLTTCEPAAAAAAAHGNDQVSQEQQQLMDNNNEASFSLEQYVKYRATPALVVDQSLQSSSGSQQGQVMHNGGDDDERMSQESSSACSLQSARTYNIRKLDANKQQLQQQQQGGSNQSEQPNVPLANESELFDENGNGKPAAWIFDPRDNSSTAIVPPARPKQPEAPKIDAKTEELNQARGGRSYYLELVEKDTPKAPAAPAEAAAVRRTRRNGGSMDSLYSRWNSQGALHHHQPSHAACRPLSSTRQNQNMPRQAAMIGGNSKLAPSAQNQSSNQANQMHGANKSAQRRQLPFGGPPASLGDRSKSSSCLLSVTRPSKYSIYGGFRKPGESNKPVPRLSYSRAIGPRSARVDTTPAAPSRYLKMR